MNASQTQISLMEAIMLTFIFENYLTEYTVIHLASYHLEAAEKGETLNKFVTFLVCFS